MSTSDSSPSHLSKIEKEETIVSCWLTPEALPLIEGYLDVIKSHPNFNTIKENEIAIYLAYISVPELRKLYEKQERGAVYLRNGDLIPEIIDFYSSHAHTINTQSVAQYIREKRLLRSRMEVDIMNDRFEGKKISKKTLDQFKDLCNEEYLNDITPDGSHRINVFCIKQIVNVSIRGLSKEEIQKSIVSGMSQAVKHLLQQFMQDVTLCCIKEGGTLKIPKWHGYTIMERKEPSIIIPVLFAADKKFDQHEDVFMYTASLYYVSLDPEIKSLLGVGSASAATPTTL